MVSKAQISNLIGWASTISFLVGNRGRNSYGHQAIYKLVDRFLYENSREHSEYQAAEKAIENFITNLVPKRENKLTRIGPDFDAGYIGVLDPLPKFLISGGAGKNIDFEIALAERGVLIHVFDHTIRTLPKRNSNLFHHKKGLYAKIRDVRNSINLAESVAMVAQKEDEKLWLKLDIEGSEWELLAERIEVLAKFDQIFIEFHDTYKLSDPKFRTDFTRIFDYLNHNFDLISISSNNWQGVTNFGMSFLPTTFEVTYIKKSKPHSRHKGTDYKKYMFVNNPNRLPIPEIPFQIK